ncbi:MAG: hypothetical protein WCP36_11860 [Methanomicrobiales archaeon]
MYIRTSNGSWTGWVLNRRLYNPSTIWITRPVNSRMTNSHGIRMDQLRYPKNSLGCAVSGRNISEYNSEYIRSRYLQPWKHSCRGTYVMKRIMQYIRIEYHECRLFYRRVSCNAGE